MFDLAPAGGAGNDEGGRSMISLTKERATDGVHTFRALLEALLLGMAVAACNASTEPALQSTDDSAGQLETADVIADMTGPLGLTPDQRAAAEQIRDRFRERFGEPGVLWYVAAELQQVLTSEQIATVGALLEERRSGLRGRRENRRAEERGDGFGPRSGVRLRGFGRGHGVPDGAAGDRGFDGLDLTADQQTALAEIHERFRPQFEALADEHRSGALSREEFRAAIQELREQVHGEAETILTPEQLAEMESRRDQHERNRADRRAQSEAAAEDALGLTEDQKSALEALRDAWSAQERPADAGERAARRDEHRQAVAEILNEDQLEIVTLHRSLASHAALRRFRGGSFGPFTAGPGPGSGI